MNNKISEIKTPELKKDYDTQNAKFLEKYKDHTEGGCYQTDIILRSARSTILSNELTRRSNKKNNIFSSFLSFLAITLSGIAVYYTYSDNIGDVNWKKDQLIWLKKIENTTTIVGNKIDSLTTKPSLIIPYQYIQKSKSQETL